MGTEVDHLGYAAHINAEDALIQKGVITAQQRANRVLLRTVMKHAGFRTLPTEWWHFNFCSRQVAKQKYKLIK
ncbi:D-alanyl-D-alanine dipeptidase [bioreactor metagenome]|jgi:D-alanyl-D-alanine dipeptidase|uniref:D-alanyl-D-alanine dipeptidase n=2 Tax=root TaxID=1 RepID=A0A645HQ04_9ZZZZ